MKITIGSDHGGYELKTVLTAYLKEKGYSVHDVGVLNREAADYPDIAEAVCAEVVSGKSEWGVVICGTGIGVSIAANKIHGIRCALVGSEYAAKMAKCHNNANVLAFGGRVLGPELAIQILEAYINASFEGGRHQKRIDKIMALENRQ